MKFKLNQLAGIAAATLMSTAAVSSDLVITFDDLNPDKKAAYDAVVDA